MENSKVNEGKDKRDQDIVFSKTIKAGKRIYYIDVKKNRKDDLFLAITESKRIKRDDSDKYSNEFEKHKIFLYKEDFEKFSNGLNAALAYVKTTISMEEREETLEEIEFEDPIVLDDEISFNIEDFE